MEENDHWSEEVKTDYHTPPGTFTRKAPDMVRILLDGAGGDPVLALRRLVFYMNRAGERLSDRHETEKAKRLLEEKIAAEHGVR